MTRFFGANRLNTKDLFEERKRYQQWIDGFSEDKTKLIDLWYQHPFYGRINSSGQTLYPKESFLKSIAQRHGEKIYAMNFVADMFNDFVEHWNSLQSSQKLVQGGKLLVIKPERAWKNINNTYDSYMDTFYMAFVQKLREHGLRPAKFDDMIEHIMSFFEDDARFTVLSKSAFITSKYSDPLISGLMIDILIDEHDLDRKKKDFIDDPNFLIFKNVAQKFNFKLDKNAPWRLIADLDSPTINSYLLKYDMNSEQMFERQYQFAFETDIDIIKRYMLAFWNRLSDQRMVCEPSSKSRKLNQSVPSVRIRPPSSIGSPSPGEIPIFSQDPLAHLSTGDFDGSGALEGGNTWFDHLSTGDFDGSGILVGSGSIEEEAWTPDEIGATLFAWWDPSDDTTVALSGANITQIDDKSGNARHLVADGTGGTIGAINGLDAVQSANSTVNYLRYSGTIDAVKDMISVHATSDANYIHATCTTALWGIAQDGSGISAHSAAGTPTYRVDGEAVSGTTRNDVHDAWSGDHITHTTGITASSQSVIRPYNNTNATFCFAGLWGEIILLTATPDTTLRQKIEGYLAWKWGLEGNLDSGHPYKSAPPTV